MNYSEHKLIKTFFDLNILIGVSDMHALNSGYASCFGSIFRLDMHLRTCFMKQELIYISELMNILTKEICHFIIAWFVVQ